MPPSEIQRGHIADSNIQRATVQYPGGLAARYRWAGSAAGTAVFGISEAGGRLTDLTAEQESGSRRCHAELHVEGPAGAWTARISSVIYDDPEGALWDEHQLLLVKYGFSLYAFAARTGDVAWRYSSSTPLIALLTSARLDHVLLQAELETIALREDGSVAWHVTHADVIADARLMGGRLDLTSYTGAHLLIDARTGTAA